MVDSPEFAAEELDAAWKAVLREARADPVPDTLRYADLALNWEDRRAALLGRMNAGNYVAAPTKVVEVPKDEFAVRPFARLSVDDRVAYEAAVRRLRPKIEAELGDTVFSARFNQKGRRRLKGVTEWTRFEEQGIQLHVEEDLSLMISTDVVSYFEYVSIEILIRDLVALSGDSRAVKYLSEFLNSLQRSNPQIWGLPQGLEASSSLGNLYLQPVDALIRQLPGVHAIRYQDDVKIFSNSESELRSALRQVNRLLRGRHLNLSVHKTKLLRGQEVLDEFEDNRKRAIDYGLKIEGSDQSGPLHALFDDAISGSAVNARDVKFAIYRLSHSEDAYAVPWILDHLGEVPYLAAHLVPYLRPHFVSHNVERRLRNFVQDPELNLYPHSELHILRLFAQADAIDQETYDLVWSILRDGSKSTEVRQQAARCIGRQGRAGAGQLLHEMLGSTADLDLARACLVAMKEVGYADRSLLGAITSNDARLAPTARFLSSVTEVPQP